MELVFGEKFTVQMPTDGHVRYTNELRQPLIKLMPGTWDDLLSDVKPLWMIQRATDEQELKCSGCGKVHPGAGDDDQCLVAGTWPKRLAALAYKRYEVRLDQQTIAQLGELARRSIFTGEVFLDTTNTIDWRAGDFGDDGSCFWDGRERAKRMITGAGGGAIRQFKDKDYRDGLSRCWILPWANGAAIFNAYGQLRLDQFANILSTKWQMAFDKVRLTNRGETSGYLYLNGGTGFYLRPTSDPVLNRINFDIDSNPTVRCARCNTRMEAGNEIMLDGKPYCRSCVTTCHRCHTTILIDTRITSTDTGRNYCPACAAHYNLHQCARCGNYRGETRHGGEINMMQVDGQWVCTNQQCHA